MSEEFRVWFNGELRESKACTVHVRSHALHYGSSVFEGIRGYETPVGTMLFRLTDHLKRLFWSASVYRIPIVYSLDEMRAACREVFRDSGMKRGYLRPLVMRGDCGIGVIPADFDAVDVAILALEMGQYLGEDCHSEGIDACITSWNRMAPNTMPVGVKAGGNYLSSQLIGMEARDRGFHEGIALGTDGLLSEGTGENVFVVRGKQVLTPPVSSAILNGITRDSVITLARGMGLEVLEQTISREQLYASDEVFFTGTAVEVTPVRRIDHMVIGNGGRGSVTAKIQTAFFGLFDGSTTDQWGWLEPL